MLVVGERGTAGTRTGTSVVRSKPVVTASAIRARPARPRPSRPTDRSGHLRSAGQDQLVRAVRRLRVHGAQRLVPADDVRDRAPAARRRPARRSAGPPIGNVVRRGARVEPVEEPQPLLRERQRHPFGTRAPASAAARAPRRRVARSSVPPGPATVGASNSARTGRRRRARRRAGRSAGWRAASGRRGRRSCRRRRPVDAEHLGEHGGHRLLAWVSRARGTRLRRPKSGAGSALRSSLPLGVSGSCVEHDDGAGTM